MKLRKNLTQQQISEYKHPWYTSVEQMIRDDREGLNRPNPPTKEAIEKAKFVDKTYVWTGN